MIATINQPGTAGRRISGTPDEAGHLETLQTRHLQAQDREQSQSEREEGNFLALFEFKGVWQSAFEHAWRDGTLEERAQRAMLTVLHSDDGKGFWWQRD